MASSGLKNGTTMESDMEQQQYEHQRGIQEKDQIIEEKDASDERKIVIVNETHTVVETAEMLTVKELQKVATMKEHNISEDFEATVCLSADAMEEIAETIAMNDNGSVEMDYSVAATLGSSVDEESVKTEDFAEENTFIEESSKDAEVDFAELAAADESIEKMNELTTGESTETMKAMKQVYNTSKAVETKEISSAMTCSVDATLGRSVDADSVLYLDDMRGSTNVDGQETTDVSVEQAMSKSAAILIHSAENNAPIKVVATETDVTSQEPVAEERSVDVTKKMKSVYKVEPVIEEASDEVLISETKGTAEIDQCVTAVATGTTSDSCEVDTANATLTEAPSEMIDSFHASTDLINSAFAIPNTATEESEHPNTATEESEHEAKTCKKTPPKRFSSMITHFAEKLALKSGSHRTDPVTKLELNPSSPVEGIVHKEADEAVSPQRDCTSSATKCFDVCDSSPVKNVVHRLETQQEDDNALESLKIRTKRDFFSEKRRSISVSHEKEKYNAQMAERAKREAETKDQVRSPAKKHSRIRKSSAMSSVRNMASRFEKKADQSLDNLSFRTVRSFFPTEKSIHVGAEKQKYEAIEQEKQSAKEAEEKFARRSFQESRIGSDVATTWTKPKAFAIVKPLAEDTVAEETLSMDDMSYTLVKPNETAALDTSRTSELHSRRHTVAGREEVPNVRGIAYRFETKRANSVVTAPVRTIDTFIVADSEVSVRVSAEKAKFENQVKTSSVPTKRTIDTFIVPKSEGSVCVSAEKAKFEAPDKQVRATVRTIDTFIVPDSKASVCVSAEKAKFEAPEKLVKAAVRTIDTFIVPESEVSIHVAAEKAKLEALEKQKQSELDAQAAIEKQKLARTMLWASEKAKLEQARQLTEEVKAIDDAMMADEMKESKVIQETEMAKPTEVTTEAETVVAGVFKTAEVAAEVSRLDDVTLGSGLATETDVVTRTMVAKAEKIREGDLASDTEAVKARLDTRIGKDDDTVVVKVIDMVKQTEVAAESKEAKEAEEVNESEVAAEGTNEVEVATVNDAEVAKMSEVVETTTGAEVAKVTEVHKVAEMAKMTELTLDSEVTSQAKLEQTAVKETEVTKHAADFRQTDVEEITKAKEADEALKLEKVEETEMDNGMMGAVALEEGLQTEEVLQTEETTKALKQNEMAKVAHDGKTIDFVQGCEMVTSMKKAKVTEEVDDIVKEDEVVKVVKETEEVTKKEAAGECNVVRTSKTVEIVDNVEAVNETLGKEKQAVRNAPNLTISAVEVTVERQTFGDNVSTAQHVHWLSLPVSVNPALARLHTVLSDHDPLTAYALYPSSPSSPSSQSG